MAARPRRNPELGELRVMPWPEFSEFFRSHHRQGEHVSIVGPTGSGKTVLGLSLCELVGSRRITRGPYKGRPSFVAVLATKPRDDSVSALGWPVVSEWPPPYGKERCVIWPGGGDPRKRAANQRQDFEAVLLASWRMEAVAIYIDEAAYFERRKPHGLQLGDLLERYWQEARSLKITLIAGTQRPRRVTRAMWSEPAWVMIFPPDDQDDLKRVAELTGRREEVFAVADELGPYEFLCLRRAPGGRRRELIVSRVDP